MHEVPPLSALSARHNSATRALVCPCPCHLPTATTVLPHCLACLRQFYCRSTASLLRPTAWNTGYGSSCFCFAKNTEVVVTLLTTGGPACAAQILHFYCITLAAACSLLLRARCPRAQLAGRSDWPTRSPPSLCWPSGRMAMGPYGAQQCVVASAAISAA
jgi:hypothetical protein